MSYEARAHGVKRGMRGDEARKACAEVQLVQVPVKHGKADLTLYRAAGKQVWPAALFSSLEAKPNAAAQGITMHAARDFSWRAQVMPGQVAICLCRWRTSSRGWRRQSARR